MPDRVPSPPKYRHYKPKNLAVVRISGRDHYLGRYGSAESKEKYARLITEWFTTGSVPCPAATADAQDHGPAVNDIILAYWGHAEDYYRTPDGDTSQEIENIRAALRPVRKLYGRTPARDFGPRALAAVRNSMIRAGLAYTTINARINRIRRVFRWAGSVEMIPGAVNHNLGTVEPLQRGRSKARDPEEIKPVPIEHVEKTLRFLPKPVAAMVQLQLLTGCRAGEVMIMRGCDLVVGAPNWEYHPNHHKNEWRGRDRVIPLGPKAQAIAKEFLRSNLDAYLFSPREALEARNVDRGQTRKSARTPSERARQARTRKRGPKHADRYDRRSYRQAVVRACDKAFPHPTLSPLTSKDLEPGQREELRRLRGSQRKKNLTTQQRQEMKVAIKRLLRRDLTSEQAKELKEWRRRHRWSPLQLRHTAGTLIRSKYGLEASQTVLGHAKADTTQLYAERDLAKAHAVMAEIG
jgi:site-specific recombinase XerD